MGAGASVFLGHRVMAGRAGTGVCYWPCVGSLGLSVGLSLPFSESPVQPCSPTS